MVRGLPVVLVLLTLAACSKDGPKTSSTQKLDPALTKIKFRVQEVADKDQGGLIAVRFAAPQDWKANGLLEWHYNDLYTPVRFSSRAESPDGSAWIETYPAEVFFWLDPRWDNFQGGTVGGIHHTNITVQQAMERYVIRRYRGKEKNLRILGYRPVSNLAQALNQPAISGEGIDFRVRYESGGQTVDEEFFGLLTPKLTIPYHGPQGTTYEYHRTLTLVHSIGAKSGKLESVRPLLGYMAHSFEVDKVWEKQRDAAIKQLIDAYNRNLAAGYAQIEAAGRLSRAISANNDAMIQAMDESRVAQRAEANAARASSSANSAEKAAEDFDQYIRGTEKMEDSSGNVSEQSSLYSYHWTDGYGNYIHSNDSSFDPNAHSNVPYEQLKQAK